MDLPPDKFIGILIVIPQFCNYCHNIKRISPPIGELLSFHFYLLLFLCPLFDIPLIFSVLKYHGLFSNFFSDIKEKSPPTGELLRSHFYLFLILHPPSDFSLISFLILLPPSWLKISTKYKFVRTIIWYGSTARQIYRHIDCDCSIL